MIPFLFVIAERLSNLVVLSEAFDSRLIGEQPVDVQTVVAVQIDRPFLHEKVVLLIEGSQRIEDQLVLGGMLIVGVHDVQEEWRLTSILLFRERKFGQDSLDFKILKNA